MPNTTSAKVEWDYTEHASHYDKRADYSYEALKDLLTDTNCTPKTLVAESGAGADRLPRKNQGAIRDRNLFCSIDQVKT
jgi:hypothetical protein